MPRVNRQAYKAAQNIDLTADGNLDISLSVFLCLYILVHVAKRENSSESQKISATIKYKMLIKC